MAYDQLIAAYVTLANQLVGSKVATYSIDPTDVASLGIELAELLLPILNTINDFAITGGTLPPDNDNGDDLDLYIQGGTSLIFWRKRNGVWLQEASVPLGIQIIDGNITLRASVNEMIVTVSSGTWSINNIIYSKATQTQLTLTDADLNFNRIDTIVADTTGAVYLLDGVASANPNPAALPANSIVVDYVYVPASSSGDLPYISDSNSSPTTVIDDAIISLVKTWSSAKLNRMPQPWTVDPTPLHGVRWFEIDGVTLEFISLIEGNISQPTLPTGATAAWTDLNHNGFPSFWNSGATYSIGDLIRAYDDMFNSVLYRSKSDGNINHFPGNDLTATYWDRLGVVKGWYDSAVTYQLDEAVLDTPSNKMYISNINNNTYAFDATVPNNTDWQLIGPLPGADINVLTFVNPTLPGSDGNYSYSFDVPDGKSIASITTTAGTVTKYIDISQAVTDTANSPNTIIEGFDNNAAQTITIKLI